MSSSSLFVPDRCVIRTFGVVASATVLYGTYMWSNMIFSNIFNDTDTSEKTPPSKEDKFIAEQTKPFIKTYDTNDQQKYNQNIDALFYDTEKYDKEMQNRNNELEPRWKRRILMQYTPFGNVIMFYDAYKQAFAYYSDSTVAYGILNAVAMKYVIKYLCRDFFIDSSILIPKSYTSPFQETKKNPEIDKKKMKESGKRAIGIKSGPFLKSKNKNKVGVNKIHHINTPTIKNKFIYLGKLYNFSILQSPPKVRKSTKEMPIKYGSFKAWRNSM